MAVMRRASDWVKQAEDALGEIRAANGGEDPASIADGAAIAPAAFSRMVEALVALEPLTHARVGADMIRLAGLVPVDQALMN
jgi:hypothetical protein